MGVEDDQMGRVMAQVKLTNIFDLQNARQGLIEKDQVRSLEIETLVDTGATMLFLPADVVARLGLPYERMRKVRYADGSIAEVPWIGGVRLEVLGREMVCDALVGPEGATPLLGQLQLEELDLIVDPKSRELRVNPASPDAPLLDLLRAS
jgi:clan AA aspartic protease